MRGPSTAKAASCVGLKRARDAAHGCSACSLGNCGATTPECYPFRGRPRPLRRRRASSRLQHDVNVNVSMPSSHIYTKLERESSGTPAAREGQGPLPPDLHPALRTERSMTPISPPRGNNEMEASSQLHCILATSIASMRLSSFPFHTRQPGEPSRQRRRTTGCH